MTGETLCRHDTTKGAIICSDCGRDVSTRPWELDQIRDRSYRQGLHAQIIRAFIAFKLGLILGVGIAFAALYVLYRIFL